MDFWCDHRRRRVRDLRAAGVGVFPACRFARCQSLGGVAALAEAARLIQSEQIRRENSPKRQNARIPLELQKIRALSCFLAVFATKLFTPDAASVQSYGSTIPSSEK